ncbi:uncharacterized protein DNG_05320 [Cephalotrichum gorgonifer]|uniref:Uncharacterized protein n=1 Tax=Cephalotrichum gorgonifer TaxID=2041049 RepID=A0AAE8MY35_9PEZI|nr:uncharacterized protein DNG_05320 [Cephalotrichum gorgonifer]
MAEQQIGASDHGGEIGAWMGAHKPSGVAIEDVDQVLAQISAELGNLATEATPETVAQTAVEQTERAEMRDLTEPQTGAGLSSVESEAPSAAGAGRPSAVSDMARKILQAVDHEDGEKWRESSFLALMRDFRDGRKDVAENSIQDIRGAAAE